MGFLKLMLEDLSRKEAELEERKIRIQASAQNEINMTTFERNLINDLLIMIELKGEISQLKHWTSIMDNSALRRDV